MKKPCSHLCVVLSSIFSISSAQSAVTLFGMVDLGLRHVKNGSAGSALSEVNGANATSHWGIRGAEDLSSGLRTQCWLESGSNADTGSSTGGTQLFDRRSTLGSVSDRAGLTGALFLSSDEGSTLTAGAVKSKGGRIGYAGGPINVAASLITLKNAPTFDLRDSVIGGSYDFGIAKVALARRTFKWGADQQVLTLLAITAPVGTVKVSYLKANQSGADATADGCDAS